MAKHREAVWLLLLGAMFLLILQTCLGQKSCNADDFRPYKQLCGPADTKYARDAEKRINGYAATIRDYQRHLAPNEVNQYYLLVLRLDRDICRRHLVAYMNGEDKRELDRALNQLSRDMENIPPGFRTVKGDD